MASNSYGMQSSVAFGRFISYFRGFKCSTNGSHANHGLRARSLDDIFCTELSHVTCRGICRVSIRFANVLDSFFQLFGDQLFQEADTTETSHHASSFELIFRMDFPHHVEASTFFCCVSRSCLIPKSPANDMERKPPRTHCTNSADRGATLRLLHKIHP